ncbi:UNVERIFIED_CONTAM: hypothetical protein Sradi_2055200 [Sesamum radiatum]|uniref:Reverse transcriptase n=1 Tax=Sesamum radiatum TaxID=300843 RepID=A0AAW2THL3_SESRA
MINLLKSAIVFSSNVTESSQVELAGILGVTVVPKHDKYLGLPTTAGRSKKELFDGIKDRMWHKLLSWLAKKLSQAGRVVLLKVVLQMISIFAMSCFRLPDTFLNELEGMIAVFFWNGGNAPKIHWRTWSKICKPKKGGLGFRRLRECNLAMQCKIGLADCSGT